MIICRVDFFLGGDDRDASSPEKFQLLRIRALRGVMSASGRVKSFNGAKGFGFIHCNSPNARAPAAPVSLKVTGWKLDISGWPE